MDTSDIVSTLESQLNELEAHRDTVDYAISQLRDTIQTLEGR